MPGAAAHVFVVDLARPELGAEDRHHLERVLRLRPGEEVTASDGAGSWRCCHYRAAAALDPVGPPSFVPRVLPLVTVAFALVKGNRPEWTVQKLTEVGVDRIIAMTTRRSVLRWSPEKAAREVARLRAVARGAAMQSRQVWLPSVTEVQAFPAVASGSVSTELPASASASASAVALASASAVALAERGGDPPSLDRPTILVGPEGGWDDAELSLELPRVALGPSVLRTETAALTAGVLLCALRGGLVRSLSAPLVVAAGDDPRDDVGDHEGEQPEHDGTDDGDAGPRPRRQ